jgi:hypothetical protein
MTTSQQRLEEIAAQEKQLTEEKAKLLATSKVADLDTVKKVLYQRKLRLTTKEKTEMATTEKLDPRAALAKMEAEETAARAAADKLEADNEKKRKELLASLKEADLADVLEKIKLHGFTATDLRTALKKKGARKATPRKSTARKTTARKSTPRKKTA